MCGWLCFFLVCCLVVCAKLTSSVRVLYCCCMLLSFALVELFFFCFLCYSLSLRSVFFLFFFKRVFLFHFSFYRIGIYSNRFSIEFFFCVLIWN